MEPYEYKVTKLGEKYAIVHNKTNKPLNDKRYETSVDAMDDLKRYRKEPPKEEDLPQGDQLEELEKRLQGKSF